MKTVALSITLLFIAYTASFAQCDKKFRITTSKTEHLDSQGNLKHADDEKAVVTISKTDINIAVNDDHKMAGTIKSDTCNWPVAYKEGKTTIKALINTDNNGDKNVTITIEGKAGKVTLLFEVEDEPDDRIRVTADKFEEVQ